MALNTLQKGELARNVSGNTDLIGRVSPKNTPYIGDSLRLYDGYAEIKNSPIPLNNPAFGNTDFNRIRTSTVIGGVRYVLLPQSNWQLYRVSDTLSSIGATGCTVPNSIWLTEETSGYVYIVGAGSGATNLKVYQTDGNNLSEITLSSSIGYSTNIDVATLPSGELLIAKNGDEYYIVSHNGDVATGKMFDSAIDQVFLERVGNAVAIVGITSGSLISAVTIDGVNWKTWDNWTVGSRSGDDGDVNATYEIQSGARIEIVDTAIFGGGFSVLASADTTHTTNYLVRFTNGGYSISNPDFSDIVADRSDVSSLTLKDRTKCTILAHGYDERDLYVTVLDNESSEKELCTYRGILSQSKTLSTYTSTSTITVPTISAPERSNGVKETFYMNADLDSKFVSVFNGLGHCYSNSFLIIEDEDNDSDAGGGLPAHDLESHTDVVYDEDTLAEGNALLRNPDGNWQNSNVIEGIFEAQEETETPAGVYVPDTLTSITDMKYISWPNFISKSRYPQLPPPVVKLVKGATNSISIWDASTGGLDTSGSLYVSPIVNPVNLTETHLEMDIFLELVVYRRVRRKKVDVNGDGSVYESSSNQGWVVPQDYDASEDKNRLQDYISTQYGQSIRTRGGRPQGYSIDRPNHYRITSSDSIVDAWEYLNARYCIDDVVYRNTSGVLASTSLAVPISRRSLNRISPSSLSGQAGNLGDLPLNKFYSRALHKMYFAYRYIAWDAKANGGLGGFIVGPKSSVLAMSSLYHPFYIAGSGVAHPLGHTNTKFKVVMAGEDT